VFFDLDRCLDPTTDEPTNDDTNRLVESCRRTYAERTPSGSGIRIIGTAPHITAILSRRGTTRGGLALEIYKGSARYLTVTGRRYREHPDVLADIGDEVLELLPLLGAAIPTEAGADARDDAALVRAIVTGEGFHNELCTLAARYVARGMSPTATTATICGMMLAHDEATRDARWRDRFASIGELIAGAVRKFADETAPDRRALAKLALRLFREGRSLASVRATVLAEAECRAIAGVRAEQIVAWAAERSIQRRGLANARS
jgi:hypothetical protein